MMEHVRHFDWCTSVHERYFVEEADLDNCNTEKILRNRFTDPLLSSESEDETPSQIDWDEIFKNKQIQKNQLFIPGLRPVPPYPKVSAMNPHQHNQFLKVLSAENPTVLEDLFLGKPTKQDFKAFEAAKETYLKEQKEYKVWAKSLWTSEHCIRALRPKPAVETVYEAEFRLKELRMKGFPKHYNVAAQIPLETRRSNCDAVMKQELIRVSPSDMPQVEVPEKIQKQFSIIRPCAVPEPCQKHPYQIILPNEEAVSMLPITEIHRELALYALNNGAQYIASENALKCLLQWNRHWMLPLSVCETIGLDGDRVNVVVLDSEFFVKKESAPMRTYKAFRHLLEYALIPSSEREKVWQRSKNSAKKKVVTSPGKLNISNTSIIEDAEMSSDDENLVIDTGEDVDMDAPKPPKTRARSGKNKATAEGNKVMSPRLASSGAVGYLTRAQIRRISEECQDIGFYSCTCKYTSFAKPPRRSFKKWQFKNKATNENHDIIIHCPHKAKDESGEVILEPLPEYQIDVGASEQSADSVRSIALSLVLRKNASVLNARVDGPTGDVVGFEPLSGEEFVDQHPDVTRQVISTLHTALSQLQGLLPGHYVLQHEPSHGANALLLSPAGASAAAALALQFDRTQLCDADETHALKQPPTITDRLLPYHKHRRILPCAFTPYENQLVKEPKKPPPKNKPPPQAIKWPKRRKSRRKCW